MKAGWDERDYKLWSEIQGLPSYGLLHGDDRMISFKAVVRIMEEQAAKRDRDKWEPHMPKTLQERKRGWMGARNQFDLGD